MKFKKYINNPILEANPDNDWESLGVLNPAVCYDGKQFVMLYRAAGHDTEHYIRLGKAVSDDGVNFRRTSDKPIFAPLPDEADAGCVEDPRVIRMGDCWYITYASRPFPPGQYWKAGNPPTYTPPEISPVMVQKNQSVTHLAYTYDFERFKKLGRLTDSRFDNRDVVLFPEKIGDKFAMLSRPIEWQGECYGTDAPSIWITFSDDMLEWNHEKTYLLASPKYQWESKKMGVSCPPMKTDAGWLVIYHGVDNADDCYRVGAMLLDIDDPKKITARTSQPLMEPEFDYETKGFYNGCVFPTAAVLCGDTLNIYYGSADRFCCHASCSFSELLEYLVKDCHE